MRNTLKRIATAALCVGLAGPALAQNFLDDMIYSAKCSGADDKEACKVKARQDFENQQQGKNRGPVVTNRASIPSDEKCQTVSAKGTVDVDTAYTRAISTFRFQTIEEKSHHGQREVFVDDGYKHVRTPGVMYDMWDNLRLFWAARNKFVTFTGSAVLKKNGSGSTVTAEYCLIRGVDPDYGDPAFWQFADESFRKLVQ